MFQKLVSHNDDIRRLVDKGYAIAFDGPTMVIRDIPYLDAGGDLQWGAIVTKLVFVDQQRVVQDDHQIYFAGGIPHEMDGTPVMNLGGGAHSLPLGPSSDDVAVQRSFSNKPRATGKFDDFYEKIESYVTRICGPAENKHGASPLTFRTREEFSESTVFKFHDTLTSRAEIADLVVKLESEVVAIIGLGGTGAYVLDFLVKTPVKEIRAFDHDSYHIHNAYRSPGRLDESELGKCKADVYSSRYSNFRDGLQFYSKRVDGSCGADFGGVTFAFVCVDKGSSRAEIIELLLSLGIPFIDVGMGLHRKAGALRGLVRMTYFPEGHGAKVRDDGFVELADGPENIYRTNIQISELNALNAAIAVIRFKQLCGFYAEEDPPYHLLFGISDLKTAGRTFTDEN